MQRLCIILNMLYLLNTIRLLNYTYVTMILFGSEKCRFKYKIIIFYI